MFHSVRLQTIPIVLSTDSSLVHKKNRWDLEKGRRTFLTKFQLQPNDHHSFLLSLPAVSWANLLFWQMQFDSPAVVKEMLNEKVACFQFFFVYFVRRPRSDREYL
ncbi:hypothetical protein TNIN_89121 [Trichonephila inaurata madagascariensis]|uniref:Uncharacterized protein n=1 Tax=Trichonephila inaurata madagascariensis TaxID=2747483 RepID=A0A8X6YJR4_9ARAC|nr:hypothetical protein TNIN_89121 [Trichonephila inaurata madagascariensis]